MNKYLSQFLLILVVVSGLVGCSRKKNSFISRNLHAVGTEYNVLYNGDLALQAGLDQLEQNYKDNYWEVLPVERMSVKDEVFLPGQRALDPNFERAEEKAVKAVQKHSMLINEVEYNPQIDEAYMLLGKARYYDQRFVPALEAFNYILQFMPESDELNRAKIWREKTNMRLDNNEIAIKNLRKLLSQDEEKFEQEDLALANAIFAQAFLNLEEVDSALVYMNKAAQQTKNRETQARYNFIAGQLFAKSGQRDSAFAHYDQLIEWHRKIPRRYYINAFIEKIKLYDPAVDSDTELIETITDLEENRENRPWLDAIYSRKAIYFHDKDSLNLAKEYFNKSLRAKGGTDKYLRGNNYSALAKISFDQAEYVNAGKYYDSAVAQYKERTPEHRLVRKKRDNLEGVIVYEGWRSSADSIFKVLAMSPQEQEQYYQVYIDSLKAQEEREARAAEVAAAKEAQQQTAFSKIQNNKTSRRGNIGPTFGGATPPGPTGPSLGNSSFYFYNTQTVARGKQDFRSKWGKRKLEDNWRRKNKKSTLDGEIEDEIVNEEEELRPEFTTSFYIEQLPKGRFVLDSIADSRDFAYYQLGVIYKEKFKRNDLAIDRFTRLLDFEPVEKLELPALYNLYLIYKEDSKTPNAQKANLYKNKIISEYPDSRYAELLRNPESKLDNSETPLAVYNRLYKMYEAEQYDQVIALVPEYVKIFNGDEIVPRLELLKAFASGRLYGFQAYKRGIDYVALNYPNSEVGKSAQDLVKKAESLKIPEVYLPEDGLTDFKLVYRFNKSEQSAIDNLTAALDDAFAKAEYSFTYSTDVYNENEKLLVIHGFNTKLGAKGLGELLQKIENGYNISRPYIAIATENYKIIQVYKSLDKYTAEMK